MIEGPHTGGLSWTFLLPGLSRPAGGLFAAYELANALASAGGDTVRVAHLPVGGARLRSLADIPWFHFHEAVEHDFLSSLDPAGMPEADVVVYTVMVIEIGANPDAGPAGEQLVRQLQARRSTAGLPILFLQALGVFPEATEMLALRGAGPKVCVSAWIASNLVRAGLPAAEVLAIANGLDHDTFRVTRPVPLRQPRVAMNFNPHPLKNVDAGVDALVGLDRDLGVPSVLFGSVRPDRPLGPGVSFVGAPRQAELSETVYNGSSIYLQPSTQEGFGLCALEAMACGCALVTTANGGSAEYAHPDETAVVCGSEPEELLEALSGLVRDDGRRIRIATAGVEHAARFRWEASAARLRELAARYVADPDQLQRGSGSELDASVRWLER